MYLLAVDGDTPVRATSSAWVKLGALASAARIFVSAWPRLPPSALALEAVRRSCRGRRPSPRRSGVPWPAPPFPAPPFPAPLVPRPSFVASDEDDGPLPSGE